MKLAKRSDGWWIEGADPYYVDGVGPYTAYGPYETKAKAEDDLRGLSRFEQLTRIECPDRPSVAASLLPGRGGAGDRTTEEARHQIVRALAQNPAAPCGA